jgi:hypothetical protein
MIVAKWLDLFNKFENYLWRIENMKTGTRKIMVTAAAALIMLAACNNGLSDASGQRSSGQNNRIDRSQRTVIDGAKYVDFTVKEHNAALYKKENVLYELNGTYRIAGGNSYITVDRIDGTVTLSSDDAWYEGKSGCNMYARFAFDVQAAGSDCLYIKMDAKKRGNLIIDAKSFTGKEIPDLLVCVPLYGFSRNRIEVSPIMNGYSAMPSGTYWAVKK